MRGCGGYKEGFTKPQTLFLWNWTDWMYTAMIMYANDWLSLKEIVKNNKVFSLKRSGFVSEYLRLANAAITCNNNKKKNTNSIPILKLEFSKTRFRALI